MNRKSRYIIGVDEAGRGPLAGPVTVGAVIVPVGWKIPKHIHISGRKSKSTPLRDSKKLSARGRENWLFWMKNMTREGKIAFATANVFQRTIDHAGISRATRTAALRAIESALRKSGAKYQNIANVYSDAGIFHYSGKYERWYQKTKSFIKGDEKIPIISLASIAAKTSRDSLMIKTAEQYPKYGFEIHKGYGTKAHIKALKRFGVSEAHRLTFVGNFSTISKGKLSPQSKE
ncbi:hypothetical protein A3I34_00740 [Candidatus Jorgensenbacteria bacterium RIFCSPLOWO2_02_FULL_45_12]|uniref:Ribonuclease n=2 Tax=Candidatus Joergenseniibacteriota TaxID=1752739 RepID=A0A1F6BPJ7_9BACT|nr:MAG: Ribonuclease HII [Candidatus Jorgensenbacteria bacterium GW2011_GWA2_45_9]OGG38831.1 MAG: hypothetical protein A3D55_02460 [Candidatus Jorgensenbacteria bacterium RIFCSPHIGHO2_02_FULL_45_20]OGG42217.1 MAG: hypothetical protein A3I34_00740 [Candidatus Jorgensenbacteria bacterium RIFCSPLOWO2_02_FULL_45_12]